MSIPATSEPFITSLDDLTLQTHFQPVFSLTHGRLVGHEALLRVASREGAAIPPNILFERMVDSAARAELDLCALEQHLGEYARQGKLQQPEWLLVNLHPATLVQGPLALQRIEVLIRDSGLRPSKLIIEVLESPLLFEANEVPAALERLRELGCLIALDDFGAGHSNFERVFDLAPDIVKLDRLVLLRAKRDPRARRILERMVSLLHEAGALVLLEGIETIHGAHIALSCDADFVQGFWFGRPAALAMTQEDSCVPMEEAWKTFDVGLSDKEDRWRESMGEHCDRLKLASIALAAGTPMPAACADFLAMPDASMCYLLDEEGRQLARVAFKDDGSERRLSEREQFEPLHNYEGARWSRRPYFRRANSYPGQVQLTRPYLTLQGSWLCFTASIAFEIDGKRAILCGDLMTSTSADPS